MFKRIMKDVARRLLRSVIAYEGTVVLEYIVMKSTEPEHPSLSKGFLGFNKYVVNDSIRLIKFLWF